MRKIEHEKPSRETEIKIRLDQDIDQILNLLKEKGIHFSEPIRQNDIIFVREPNQFPDVPLGEPVVRIREQDGNYILTLKKGIENELDTLELEVQVSDERQMANILENLGLTEVVRVDKVRRIARHNNFTFCLDSVDDLGVFLEVELISNEGGQVVQDSMVSMLSDLGLVGSQRVSRGYDSLLFNKK